MTGDLSDRGRVFAGTDAARVLLERILDSTIATQPEERRQIEALHRWFLGMLLENPAGSFAAGLAELGALLTDLTRPRRSQRLRVIVDADGTPRVYDPALPHDATTLPTAPHEGA